MGETGYILNSFTRQFNSNDLHWVWYLFWPLYLEVLTETYISLAFPKSSLAIEILPQIDISPLTKILSCSSTTRVAIPAIRRNLSRCNQLASESVPGLLNEHELTITTYIDGFTHKTIFICKVCNTDHYRSTAEIKRHLKDVHLHSIKYELSLWVKICMYLITVQQAQVRFLGP